jgi:hypothetical protein
MARMEESELVGLGHLINAVRKEKNKSLGSCLLANSRQQTDSLIKATFLTKE